MQLLVRDLGYRYFLLILYNVLVYFCASVPGTKLSHGVNQYIFIEFIGVSPASTRTQFYPLSTELVKVQLLKNCIDCLRI